LGGGIRPQSTTKKDVAVEYERQNTSKNKTPCPPRLKKGERLPRNGILPKVVRKKKTIRQSWQKWKESNSQETISGSSSERKKAPGLKLISWKAGKGEAYATVKKKGVRATIAPRKTEERIRNGRKTSGRLGCPR